MNIEGTSLADAVIITPRRFGDARGHFIETYRAAAFSEAVGHAVAFVQDNFSYSAQVNTVRGLHFQLPPHPQGKLVRCTRGALLDIAVDARVGSPTYGQHIGVELTADNDRQLWVPPGFLHGFRTLVPDTEIAYKCTDYYVPSCDSAVAWNDPDLSVDWGLPAGDAILSDKDQKAQSFADFDNPFTYQGA